MQREREGRDVRRERKYEKKKQNHFLGINIFVNINMLF